MVYNCCIVFLYLEFRIMKKLKIKEIWDSLGVYQGIVLFLIVMFGSNFFWKLTVYGDENGLEASFLCFDVSSVFAGMCYHLASVVHWFYDLIGISTELYETTVYYENGNGVRVVWGCNGIKQSFIFTMIMLFARGPMKHKLWFIPLGLVGIYLINIVRLIFLTYIVRDHRDMFDFWHEGVTKYLFYGLIFLIWVFWNDYLCPYFYRNKKS